MHTVVVLSRHQQLVDLMLILIDVSSYILALSFRLCYTHVYLHNIHLLPSQK